MARFNVVIPRSDGGLELHPMKEWLRQHQDQVPPGLDPTNSTSHQLRDGLRRKGWSVQTTADEVRLTPPGGQGAEEVIAAVLGTDVEATEEQAEETAFRFETQLRDFIAQNLPAIDVQGQRLKLYSDDGGRTGIEYPTQVGPIDILAVDSSGAFYVFELKRARSPDHAIGQLTRYMGCLRKRFGPDRKVNGVIVAREITQSLRYAIAVIPNVSLFEYEVQFKLNRAENVGEDG
ncbi:MAG: endonuclease NucS domain-containing protein [Burkholderiales bacterium]